MVSTQHGCKGCNPKGPGGALGGTMGPRFIGTSEVKSSVVVM